MNSVNLSHLCQLSIYSKFEEKLEEMRGVETPPRPPPASSSGSIQTSAGTMVAEVTTVNETGLGAQNTRMCPDLDASDDFVGRMTKIVPSDADVSALMQYTKLD